MKNADNIAQIDLHMSSRCTRCTSDTAAVISVRFVSGLGREIGGASGSRRNSADKIRVRKSARAKSHFAGPLYTVAGRGTYIKAPLTLTLLDSRNPVWEFESCAGAKCRPFKSASARSTRVVRRVGCSFLPREDKHVPIKCCLLRISSIRKTKPLNPRTRDFFFPAN